MRHILLVLFTLSCSPATRTLDQYVAGAVDAVEQAAPTEPPTIVVDWRHEGPMGECKRIDGAPIVYLYPRVILRAARTTQEARSLIRDVLAHELAHAVLSCSDKDHEVMQ
jgi:hypothetical protein